MKFKIKIFLLILLFIQTISCSKNKVTVFEKPKILYFFDSKITVPIYREPNVNKKLGEINYNNFDKIKFLSLNEIQTKQGEFKFYQVNCLKEWSCDNEKGYVEIKEKFPIYDFGDWITQDNLSSIYLINFDLVDTNLSTFEFLEKKSKKFPENGLSFDFLRFWVSHPENYKKAIDLYGFLLHQKQLPLSKKIEAYNSRNDSYLNFYGLIPEVKLDISYKEIELIKDKLDQIYMHEEEKFFNQDINFDSIAKKFNSINIPFLQEKILEEFIDKGSFEIIGRSYNLLGNSYSSVRYTNWKFEFKYPEEVSFTEELEGLEKKQIYISSIKAISNKTNLVFQIETSEGQIELKSIEISNAFGLATKIQILKKELSDDYKKILEDNSYNQLLALALKFGSGGYNLKTETYEYEINNFDIIYAYFKSRNYVKLEKDYSGRISLANRDTVTWYVDYNKKTKIRSIVMNMTAKRYGRDGYVSEQNINERCFENEPLKFSFKARRETLNKRYLNIKNPYKICELIYFGVFDDYNNSFDEVFNVE